MDPWKDVPEHYKAERWGYDYDEKNSVFFVHSGGHRILDCEDSEVAHAVCLAFNTRNSWKDALEKATANA